MFAWIIFVHIARIFCERSVEMKTTTEKENSIEILAKSTRWSQSRKFEWRCDRRKAIFTDVRWVRNQSGCGDREREREIQGEKKRSSRREKYTKTDQKGINRIFGDRGGEQKVARSSMCFLRYSRCSVVVWWRFFPLRLFCRLQMRVLLSILFFKRSHSYHYKLQRHFI